MKVLHHPLNMGKISPDPIRKALLINCGSVMERRKHCWLNCCQSLGRGNLPYSSGKNSMEAPN
ncbi:hypothetical protein BB934_07360 [Microvirga ossetica]|uniref:Uncharacterized protein n=1 Tax=Microvirga ossetica TaxID=1882682 RepID=A0A1B2EDL4_9HYPH|nr:hypothetical protein BB934_07360 [Microvirga ossetica]